MHVATTTRRYKGKVYRTHLLRRTFREEGKVKHETLGNLSHLPEHVIAVIRRALKGETLLSGEETFECLRSLPQGQVAAVLGTLRKLELDRILGAKPSRERAAVIAMVVARVLDPSSKLATARGLNGETAWSVLGEALGLDSVTERELYEAMDWLLQRQPSIERKLAARHLEDGTLVLYDVTSSYYEGRTCPLAKFGHNRDGKKGKLQIVYGLLCNREGCPIAVEVFAGNTSDPKTLTKQIEKIRARFGLRSVVLIGDRGLLTNARIREELAPIEGLHWITALRAPAIRALLKQGAFERSLFDERDLAEITAPEYPGERLIVCRNPLLQAERARKREELLRSTEKLLDSVVAATKRARAPLRGAGKIGQRVGAVVNKFKVAKHFSLDIRDDSFSYQRKTESIEEEAALDGIYIVRTDVSKREFIAEETVGAYKSLSRVERAFRSMKTVDLKVRPIFHHLEGRVQAHVFLCMLAYYVEWHMRQALAPILFDDDHREQAEQQRRSVVAPAKRSAHAEQKARTKRTAFETPVHSFQTLLQDLGTIGKNVLRVRRESRETFTLVTTPTPGQQRAFDLLGVSHRL